MARGGEREKRKGEGTEGIGRGGRMGWCGVTHERAAPGGIYIPRTPLARLNRTILLTSSLRASAIDIGWTSVCPSVRPSHAGIVSKRLNILSCFLRHTIYSF